MNRPEFITFTGVDERTDLKALRKLSKLYPIEWGVLVSPMRSGFGMHPRYPSLNFIDELGMGGPIRLSLHLCGAAALEVIEEGKSSHDEALVRYFTRAQINTARPNIDLKKINRWAFDNSIRAVIQCRGAFPTREFSNVDFLFDASGGRGLYPSDWPHGLPASPMSGDLLVGYAGGLAPHNVAAAIEVMGQRAKRYYVDMESGVRDENDNFDLERCRLVCEAVYGVPKQ
jgi:hypothetical protein